MRRLLTIAAGNCVLLTGLCMAAPAASVPASGPAATQPVEMLPAATPALFPTGHDAGYSSLWYASNPRPQLVGIRLSGGIAFCPAEHTPVAQYVPATRKTFFTYAAGHSVPTQASQDPVRMMISYFDHATGTVPVPVTLVDNLPGGTYGCPSLTIDAAGRIWVFLAFLGTDHPSLILRSVKPYDIETWEKVAENDWLSPQPWYIPGQGFLVIHGRKVDDRPVACFSTSSDGLTWTKPQLLADFGLGHSFLSARFQSKVGVVLTYCTEGMPPDQRTNLYYLETSNLGKTWQIYPRANVNVPLKSPDNKALACDYTNRLRYVLNDLIFDPRGNPLALYIMRNARRSPPAPESRIWYTTRWAMRGWETTGSLTGDSDFDSGCLMYAFPVWYAIVPTAAGPQPNSPGGILVRWKTDDQGRSWIPQRLTQDSPLNQNWVRRPVDADPQLALIWAEGNSRKPSETHILFADREGNVYVLPSKMTAPTAKPELRWKAPEPETQPESTKTASKPAATQTAPH